jgi:hypothetical protein
MAFEKQSWDWREFDIAARLSPDTCRYKFALAQPLN